MSQIGLIGVGFVGKLFVDRLRKADYPVTVYDVDEMQIEYATERGAQAVGNPAAVAEQAEIVVLALPGRREVEAVMESEDGLLDAVASGQLIIDTTTTGPETAVKYERRCADQDVGFISAPLTRNAPGGIHMMVGGNEQNCRKATDILDCLSAAHKRIGEIGDGQTFKLMLQLRYAGHRAIDAEIVAFGRDNGVNPRLLSEFLGLELWEKYLSNDFEQEIEGMGGRRIWQKDVGYALDVARQNNTALPLSSGVHEAYKATARVSDSNEGHAAAIIQYWQRLNGQN
jgi:3-hydroxyisobutyrate dehydrogenase-like beta-hydroxyacid dehydrogenase